MKKILTLVALFSIPFCWAKDKEYEFTINPRIQSIVTTSDHCHGTIQFAFVIDGQTVTDCFSVYTGSELVSSIMNEVGKAKVLNKTITIKFEVNRDPQFTYQDNVDDNLKVCENKLDFGLI